MDVNGERVVEVEIERLHSFKNHPFRVSDDEDMYRLAESVRQNGLLRPAVVRPDGTGAYEIISGHRRKRACELCGFDKMPVIIRNMDDDAAIIFMTDSNIQRTSLLVSERAFAGKMRYEAMKRQGKRPDADESDRGESIDRLARDYNCSPASMRRLFRMTYLVPGLLDLVDQQKLAFNTAAEISYLTEDEQEIVRSFIESDRIWPSLEQAKELRKHSRLKELTDDKLMEILMDEKLKPINVRLKASVMKRFFPEGYTASQIESVIIELLTVWAEGRSAVIE